MVTNVGMLEVHDCFAPNNLVSKAVFLFALGKVIDKAVPVNGKIEIRPMMNLGLTIDHRFLDGGRCKILTKLVIFCSKLNHKKQ